MHAASCSSFKASTKFGWGIYIYWMIGARRQLDQLEPLVFWCTVSLAWLIASSCHASVALKFYLHHPFIRIHYSCHYNCWLWPTRSSLPVGSWECQRHQSCCRRRRHHQTIVAAGLKASPELVQHWIFSFLSRYSENSIQVLRFVHLRCRAAWIMSSRSTPAMSRCWLG